MRVHIRNPHVAALVLPIVLTIGVVGAYADTIFVCWDGSGDYLTIQEGIDAASDGDEVVVCDGVYTGPGNKNLDFGAKPITVRSESGNPETCIIDCEWYGRGFYFHSGETAASLVDGFTIMNGVAFEAGGMYCENSSPTIANCWITGNATLGDGAGILCVGSSPTIIDCVITRNTIYS